MNNDQFLQYYLEKQAARRFGSGGKVRPKGGPVNANAAPPAVKAQIKRMRAAVQHDQPRTNSAPASASHPDRQVFKPNFELRGKPKTTFQATRPARPVREAEIEAPVRTEAESPIVPVRNTPDYDPQAAYNYFAKRDVGDFGEAAFKRHAGPTADPTDGPTGRTTRIPREQPDPNYRRYLNWPLIIGAGTGGAGLLGAAGYGAYKAMNSGGDTAPAPATAPDKDTTNTAPEVNTPKEEADESWWADVLSWIKENPELAMLVLGGGGLGIGALLGSR